MSFFDRLANIWKGFLSLFISDIENKNPAAVYEAAIDERIQKHSDLKKAVSGIVYLRNKLQAEYDDAKAKLHEIIPQIEVAVSEGQDDVALVLLETRQQLEAKLASTEAELEKVTTQANEAKEGLIAFQAEIEKLKREKIEMLAKKENAEARIKIQETLSGLSVDADVKALDNVRESIHKLHAEADVSTEIQGSSLDARLAKIKAKTGNAVARSKLDEMKKQMAAQKAAAQGEAAARTM